MQQIFNENISLKIAKKVANLNDTQSIFRENNSISVCDEMNDAGGSQQQQQQFLHRGPDDPNDDDNEYDLCFVVEEVEFLTLKQGFVIYSPYLRELLETLGGSAAANQVPVGTIPQIRILLPLWATARAFRVLLDFVNAGLPLTQMLEELSISENDMSNIQNVLWLADFFQILPLQQLCIDRHIVPRLNHENVLPFLEDAFSKLAQCQQSLSQIQEGETLQYLSLCEDMWYDFFTKCLETCSFNFDKLIKQANKEKELLALPEAILQEIFERAFKNMHFQLKGSGYALETIVKFLMKSKSGHCSSIFELLEQEKSRALQTYSQQTQIQTKRNFEFKPLLTWKLSSLNLRQNFYRESDVFQTSEGQHNWRLFISKTNDRECHIGVKYCPVPGEKEMYQTGHINKILSLINWVKISSSRENTNSFPQNVDQALDFNFSHLTMATTPQTVLQTTPLYMIHQANSYNAQATSQNASLNLEVYFHANYTVAALLTYIRDRFGQLTTKGDAEHPVKLLNASELSLLMSDRCLGVKSEDETVDGFQTWLHSHIDDIEDRVLVEDLLKQVNWAYVSFERMLDLYRTFPKLRTNIHAKGIFQSQLKYRATKTSSNTMKGLPPPRLGYDSLMIETMFDFHYFLDKVSDYLLKSFDHPEQSRQSSMSKPMNRGMIVLDTPTEQNQFILHHQEKQSKHSKGANDISWLEGSAHSKKSQSIQKHQNVMVMPFEGVKLLSPQSTTKSIVIRNSSSAKKLKKSSIQPKKVVKPTQLNAKRNSAKPQPYFESKLHFGTNQDDYVLSQQQLQSYYSTNNEDQEVAKQMGTAQFQDTHGMRSRQTLIPNLMSVEDEKQLFLQHNLQQPILNQEEHYTHQVHALGHGQQQYYQEGQEMPLTPDGTSCILQQEPTPVSSIKQGARRHGEELLYMFQDDLLLHEDQVHNSDEENEEDLVIDIVDDVVANGAIQQKNIMERYSSLQQQQSSFLNGKQPSMLNFENNGTEMSNHDRHIEKVRLSQRRLSGMKFMGELNHSFVNTPTSQQSLGSFVHKKNRQF